jgi:hypothetical protein
MFFPNHRHEVAIHCHEVAIKMIRRYLVGTWDKGMILKPTATLNINAHPDAICMLVRSCTRFVITVANCPVLWSSKLQTETAMSMMEAEVIALGKCYEELFPIIGQVAEIV